MLQENDSGSTISSTQIHCFTYQRWTVSVNAMTFNPALWVGLKPAMRGASRRQVPGHNTRYLMFACNNIVHV